MRRNRCTARGGRQIRQQRTDHELVDYTRSSGSVGVGMNLLNTSWDRNKVCWRRDHYTRQEPTQWMARYNKVPKNRACRLQQHDGNVENGRAPDQN